MVFLLRVICRAKHWLGKRWAYLRGHIREGFIGGEHGMVAKSHASVLGSNFA